MIVVISGVAAVPSAADVLVIIVDEDARASPAIAALIAIVASACRRMVIVPARTPHNSLRLKFICAPLYYYSPFAPLAPLR